MLIDKVTKQTFSSGISARRILGITLFNKKVKNNELEYVEVK